MTSISIFKSITFRPHGVTIIVYLPCYLKVVTFRWSLSLCKSQNKRFVSAGLKLKLDEFQTRFACLVRSLCEFKIS